MVGLFKNSKNASNESNIELGSNILPSSCQKPQITKAFHKHLSFKHLLIYFKYISNHFVKHQLEHLFMFVKPRNNYPNHSYSTYGNKLMQGKKSI
jgi:hypothetical protein